MVVVGRLTAAFGVRGGVKVQSLTDPPENLCHYRPWFLATRDGGWEERSPSDVRSHGKGLVASFEGVADRDGAEALAGRAIAVSRAQLPEPEEDEWYWVDLVGLRVVTTGGLELGRVDHLVETGANDVLVVQGDRERLIPFLPGDVVTRVSPEQGLVEVDWDPDF